MAFESMAVTTAWSVVGVTAVLLGLNRLLSPSIHDLEPPVLKPRIPFLGHAITMAIEKAGFYSRVLKESAEAPICTIPVLHRKLYIINKPSLIHAANRNNDISFQPLIEDAYKKGFALDDKQMTVVKSETERNEMMTIMRSTLTGEPLRLLNVAALGHLMDVLNRVGSRDGLVVPDTSLWLRRHLTTSTSRGLYGEKTPLTDEYHHLTWELDEGFVYLTLGLAPQLLATKSLAARTKIQDLLIPYYEAKYDELPGTSEIIRQRASVLRDKGFTDEQLGRQEIFPLWAAVINTTGVLFWAMVQLFSRPDYVARVRAEFESIASISEKNKEGGARTATVSAAGLDKACPVLNAIYQETLRHDLNAVGARSVVKDTTIKDPDGGREYLLKQGALVQWATQVTGFLENVWGSGAEAFDPERFIPENLTQQAEKRQRGALIPFGGGRHLCPGRFLASAQILGFLGVLATGFEVDGLERPDAGDPKMGAAPREPIWGTRNRGFTLRRRKGWEDVNWVFV